MTGLAPGSYVIEVSHPTFVFPPFRVDISSKSGKYLQLPDTPGRLLGTDSFTVLRGFGTWDGWEKVKSSNVMKTNESSQIITASDDCYVKSQRLLGHL